MERELTGIMAAILLPHVGGNKGAAVAEAYALLDEVIKEELRRRYAGDVAEARRIRGAQAAKLDAADARREANHAAKVAPVWVPDADASGNK